MSKIVLVSREWNGSTGRYAQRLVQYLEQLESEHEFVVLLKPEDMDNYRPRNPRFSKIACPHKEFSFDEQIGLKRQLQGLKPDLVHFTMVQQPVWYTDKVVTTMHDLTTCRFRNPSKNPIVYELKQQVYKWVNKKVARKSAAVITPTEFVRSDVSSFTGIPSDKIIVTYEAADHIDDEPVAVTGLDGASYIMYIGRPMPHKNLPRLIEAFKLLKQTHPDLKLVLAGKKDLLYESIEQVVRAQGTPDIVFTGFVSEAQLRWLYEHCAAYVFPSLSEGFGLPGLEAMAHHAPVVSSNATCLPEVYEDAAHYFDPVDINDMAHRIREVLDDSQLRETLQDKGRVQVAKYSWQRLAEQTLAVYNEALTQQ